MEDNMLDFVARVFRGWMNFILWVILIGCSIGFFVTGGNLFGHRGFSIGYAFLGLIIGFFIGLVTIILSGGLIANFLNMVDDIATIKNQLSKSGNTTSGSTSGININNNIPPINKNYGDSWVCKKCSQKNPMTSSTCKGCGEYK
jgi:ribosomal protein L40E